MKIPYKKKRDLLSLISAILWGIYAGYGFWKNSPNAVDYIALICSISFLLYFLFDKKVYYLTMRNGILKTGKFIGKKINLSDIIIIIEKEKKYVLKTQHTELIIDAEIIDSESLAKLTIELKKLNIKWEKPLANSA